MLDRLFAFRCALRSLPVEKIKTIGDAYMVAAGIPEPRPDHVEAVANMALDMGSALAEAEGEAFSRLAVRIGIHTGPVAASSGSANSPMTCGATP